MPSPNRASGTGRVADRTWTNALLMAVVIVVIATAASALINPLAGPRGALKHRGGADAHPFRGVCGAFQEAMGVGAEAAALS